MVDETQFEFGHRGGALSMTITEQGLVMLMEVAASALGRLRTMAENGKMGHSLKLSAQTETSLDSYTPSNCVDSTTAANR